MDNSVRRASFAARRHPRHSFLAGDAFALPILDKSFDASMLIDTSHHIPDESLRPVLAEMVRVTRKCILVSDPVITPDQSRLSALFYSCFRTADQMEHFLRSVDGVRILSKLSFSTFPGLYRHTAFVLGLEPVEG